MARVETEGAEQDSSRSPIADVAKANGSGGLLGSLRGLIDTLGKLAEAEEAKMPLSLSHEATVGGIALYESQCDYWPTVASVSVYEGKIGNSATM